MWYNFDVQKFGWQMLPPLLRGRVILALLRAMLSPLVWLYARLVSLRRECAERLAASGQSLALVEALRRSYSLHEGDIYIVDAEDRQVYLYPQSEAQQAIALSRDSEDAPMLHLIFSDEASSGPDFYLYIPDFLQGQAEEILRLVHQYKPAGRQCEIIYYPYE